MTMRKEEQPIVERLRADDEFNNRGPGYEPLRVPASALRLIAEQQARTRTLTEGGKDG
ncbi:MAG: hypothetical protein JJ864_08695 [Rhizobiaceae bacterium]|nr:hypothetical protein [Rhizobiaceae bacterium]